MRLKLENSFPGQEWELWQGVAMSVSPGGGVPGQGVGVYRTVIELLLHTTQKEAQGSGSSTMNVTAENTGNGSRSQVERAVQLNTKPAAVESQGSI